MLKELKARPLALLLAGLLIGLTFPAISWLFCIAVGLGIIFRQGWLSTVGLGAYIAGFLIIWHEPPPVLSAGPFHGKVVIHSFPNFQKGKSLYAFETLEGERRTGVIRVDPSIHLSPFAIVDIEGKANKTKTGSLTPSRVTLVSSWTIFDWFVQAQRWAIRRTNENFGVEDGAWVTALAFNFPSDLSPEEKSDLRFNGTYHMVSASGTHVYVIAFVLSALLLRAGLKRHWQLLSIFLLLCSYCAITGFHAPTLRASLMWLIGVSAYLFRRSPDGFSALCLSALVWLIFVPSDAFTAGFQLSYIVSGALLLWFERQRFEFSKTKRLAIEASLVATVAAEPLAAWWFGQIIFIGPISNLLIEIPSSAVMVLGFLCLIPWLGQLLVYVAKPLIWWMRWVTPLTASFPSLVVRRYTLPSWIYIFYYGFLLWIVLGNREPMMDPLKTRKRLLPGKKGAT